MLRIPRYLLIAALATWGMSVLYTLRWNPELRFLKAIAIKKESWARQLSTNGQPKTLIFGGSSCAFSINGERMLARHGIPMVNFGLAAGHGPKVLTEEALSHLSRGDTLLIALEPALVTETLEPTPLGIQYALIRNRVDWVVDSHLGVEGISYASALLALRPGGYHAITLLGKVLSGQPLYRYQPSDVTPSGWQQTSVRRRVDGPPTFDPHVPPSSRAFLRSIAEACAQRGIRVAYSLPWGYSPPDRAQEQRERCRTFLLQVLEEMPVLKDPLLGVHGVVEDYADTVWHLTESGAAKRTDSLAAQLSQWSLWTREDLAKP